MNWPGSYICLYIFCSVILLLCFLLPYLCHVIRKAKRSAGEQRESIE